MRIGYSAGGMQGNGLLDVPKQHCMPYMHASDRATADQHYRVADNDPVAALQRQFGSAWVWEAYVMATGEEVNLLGLISNCLLAVRGSMQPHNRRDEGGIWEESPTAKQALGLFEKGRVFVRKECSGRDM